MKTPHKNKFTNLHTMLGMLKDLAEEKLKEKKIDESEIHYRDLMENLNEGVLAVDTHFNIVFANTGLSEMLGYEPHEITGRQLSQFMIEKKFLFTKEHLKSVQKNWHEKYECVLYRKDGKKIYVLMKICPLLDNDGAFEGALASVSDVSDLKNLYKSLEEKESLYWSLIKNMQGMVYRGKSDWSVEIVSGSEEICGYTGKDFLMHTVNWLDLIHPDDRENICHEGVLLALRQGRIIQHYRIVDREGHVRWVEDRKSSVFDKTGCFVGIDGLVIDITEKKASDDLALENALKYQTVFNASPDAIYRVAPDGKIIECNEAALTMTGYSQDELLGKQVDFLYADESKQKECFEEWHKTGKLRNAHLVVQTKDNGRKDVELNINTLYDKNGEVTSTLFVQRDITQRKI